MFVNNQRFNFVGRNPSLGANGFSVSQEFSRRSYSINFLCRVHNDPLLDPIPREINPVRIPLCCKALVIKCFV